MKSFNLTKYQIFFSSVLGKIFNHKRNTISRSGKKECTNCWLPLQDSFGSILGSARDYSYSYSQLHNPLFKHIVTSSSEILSKRKNVRAKAVIFPVTDLSKLKRGKPLPRIAYMKMTISGGNKFVTKRPMNVFQAAKTAPAYHGWDWNWCGNNHDCPTSNHDRQGSFNTKLSHRAILYWEPYDTSYQMTQWFHATPLHLGPSPSYRNQIWDIEFFVREK